jgi:hypothetical protein
MILCSSEKHAVEFENISEEDIHTSLIFIGYVLKGNFNFEFQ